MNKTRLPENSSLTFLTLYWIPPVKKHFNQPDITSQMAKKQVLFLWISAECDAITEAEPLLGFHKGSRAYLSVLQYNPSGV